MNKSAGLPPRSLPGASQEPPGSFRKERQERPRALPELLGAARAARNGQEAAGAASRTRAARSGRGGRRGQERPETLDLDLGPRP